MSKRPQTMTLEQCARRMTALLARRPRRPVTRKLLATLPKRPPVVVSPAEYALVETQAERDARRYAEWVARGKPPSPPATTPPKRRLRPKARTVPIELSRMIDRIAMAQDMLCAGCCEPLDLDTDDQEGRASLDHVVPRSRGGGNERNLVAMHRRCNGLKDNRMPTGCELIWLDAVNVRLFPTPGS